METKFSCVVDTKAKFAYQAQLWAWTLTELIGIDPTNIVIHFTPECSDALLQEFAKLGVHTPRIERHSSGNPYCNKLNQLKSPLLREADRVVLCDADMAFCQPLDAYLDDESIAAKVVDLPNPTEAISRALLEKSGMADRSEWLAPSIDVGGQKTFRGNCNGGLYVIPQRHISALDERWNHWAGWLAEQAPLLGDYAHHGDQLGFALAVIELDLPLNLLPLESNFPLNLSGSDSPYREQLLGALTGEPAVIHYHGRLNESGFVVPIQSPLLDGPVARVNELIRTRRRREFSNTIFWNYRYENFANLGSGVGSRGNVLERKRAIIYPLLKSLGNPTVADIGCGDLEVMRGAHVSHYAGIDVSQEALALCRQKRPDWHFLNNPLGDFPERFAEIVICLDVLIHQETEAAYRALVGHISRLADKGAIVAAYNQPPWITSEITFYYEPVSTSLLEAGFRQLEIIGGYRDITLLYAVK